MFCQQTAIFVAMFLENMFQKYDLKQITLRWYKETEKMGCP